MTNVSLIDDLFNEIDLLKRQIKTLEQSSKPRLYARAYGSTHGSIVNNGTGTIAFDEEEEFSLGGLHSTVTNNSRMTATQSGVYVVTASVTTVATVAARVVPHIAKGGSSIARGTSMANTAGEGHVSTIVHLDVGEYVEFQVQNFSGSSITPLVGNQYTYLAMVLESL